jgi:hypothetical protein
MLRLRQFVLGAATAGAAYLMACSSPFDPSATDIRGAWQVNYTTMASFAPIGAPVDTVPCHADFTGTIQEGAEVVPDTLFMIMPESVPLSCEGHAAVRWSGSGRAFGLRKAGAIVELHLAGGLLWGTATLTDGNHMTGAEAQNPDGHFAMKRP